MHYTEYVLSDIIVISNRKASLVPERHPGRSFEGSHKRSLNLQDWAYTWDVKFPLPGQELVALIIAVSFAAGLNVYATVATLGILGRSGVLVLPGQLHLLTNRWVIAASLGLFMVEFFADKIPAFDLIWNALHTFIRVPVAALLAYQATANLSPAEQLGATLLGGLIALAAHGGKTAVRAAVTPSPEPFSNIGLSLGEDSIAVALTWLATQHPFWAASIAAASAVLAILLIRWVWRAVASLFRSAERRASPLIP